jgi:hypothetical protein
MTDDRVLIELECGHIVESDRDDNYCLICNGQSRIVARWKHREEVEERYERPEEELTRLWHPVQKGPWFDDGILHVRAVDLEKALRHLERLEKIAEWLRGQLIRNTVTNAKQADRLLKRAGH